MKYTENYHLPQWDETDRIMRTDFNQMCADMETGLLKTARDASENTAAVSANAAQASQRAQATADKAVQDAARAQAKANAAYSPDQPPYVVGNYRGNGSGHTISLGFQPRFVIISGGTNAYFQILAGPETQCAGHLIFNSDGFTVKTVRREEISGAPLEVEPFLSYSGTTYNYIAFR
ncbi:MAG: hypothetical protein K2O45_17200 [Oscillospiraceae bacterium]|nr:hypothetical protein [Oscillospiraceae bacterium]